MIQPMMIAKGKMYCNLLPISVKTFLVGNKNASLIVLTDSFGENILQKFEQKNWFLRLKVIMIEEYEEKAKKDVKIYDYSRVNVDELKGVHNRVYSSLKPLIMHHAAKDHARHVRYILSLDTDSVFTGDIMTPSIDNLIKFNHKFDLYLVARADPRVHQTGGGHLELGSGYHLWRQAGKFIKLFIDKFHKKYAGKLGGNQRLINNLMDMMPSKVLTDPLLHFVSPDVRNPALTDKAIKTFKNAYIHLHGQRFMERQLRFYRAFYEK